MRPTLETRPIWTQFQRFRIAKSERNRWAKKIAPTALITPINKTIIMTNCTTKITKMVSSYVNIVRNYCVDFGKSCYTI